MEAQQKVLSHLVMPRHTYHEQYCFQKESLGGLAQWSGVNVVVVVHVVPQCPMQKMKLCSCGAWSQVRLFTWYRRPALTVERAVMCSCGVAVLP